MKGLKSRILVLAAGAAVVCASSAITASTAHAATGWDRCPSGYFCIFDGHDGTGKMAYFQWGSPNLAGQGMDNMTSSYWNRTSRWWTAWDAYNYAGHFVFTSQAGGRSNIPVDWFANNRASSLKAT
ncbi:peptidase inhibitor family I36 protein [Spirillospora sp. CA-142024]|uniref:peptidase inhibitor family I36 protein n=1 Tax=Spirillospora sp. CA-142024 TaxID=3240036 RepID=UPI003D8F7268